MRLAQVIRDHFDEITNWRGTGMQWSEVDTQIRELGLEPKCHSVRRLYYRELTRRKSPARQDTFSWVSNHYEAIQLLLDKRYDWPTILTHLQPGWDVTDTLPTLNRIITEFNTIDKARSARAQSEQLPHPEVTSSSSSQPDLPALTEPAPVAVSSPPKTPRKSKPAPAANQPQSEPEPGTVAALMKEYGHRNQEKPRRPAYVKPKPQDDPYVSGPELIKQYDEAQTQANELYFQMQKVTGAEKEELSDRREAIGSQADQLKVNFDHRFSHAKATRSKLAVLSAVALACGAYQVVDQKSDRTIELRGYDRPDHIDGVQDIPDPLFIQENLTPEDQAKIAQAYLQDKETFPDTFQVNQLQQDT